MLAEFGRRSGQIRQIAGHLADRTHQRYTAVGIAQLLEPFERRFGSEDRGDARFYGVLRFFKLPWDQIFAAQTAAELGPEFRLQRTHR